MVFLPTILIRPLAQPMTANDFDDQQRDVDTQHQWLADLRPQQRLHRHRLVYLSSHRWHSDVWKHYRYDHRESKFSHYYGSRDVYGQGNLTLTVPVATGILANAFDPTSGATVTANVITPTANGTLQLAPNGAFTYTPRSGFTGTDSFTYQATDGTLTSATTTVTISVTPNIVTTPDTYTVTAGQTLTIPFPVGGVLRNDTDPTAEATMTALLVSTTTHGTLTLHSDGTFSYVPASGFTGTDTFTYQATDGTLTSPVTTTTITVNPVAPAITAVADSYPTVAGQMLNVPVASGILSNDTDTRTGATMTAGSSRTPPAEHSPSIPMARLLTCRRIALLLGPIPLPIKRRMGS